ncbi:MGDG synthase family glycosyltransferase [Propionicicella superfundia]|uniref:MGDG synthase family glycosyltransferase n=1 Tax=Propionicicella superfundia TaxID=348582 RepID=UPI001B7FD7C2|nr:glycosyltransferase [Propionicicella superfundia]
MRTLILAAGVGSGHNSAAQAVETALAEDAGAEVRRIDILDTTNEVFSKLYDDAYFTLVAQVPWLVGWGYDNQDPPFKLAPVMRWWDQANTVPVMREIRDFDPDLVIATHFLPARLVSLMLARGQVSTSLSVVTTDFDFQGLWLTTPVTRLFVAREETRQHLLRLGLPPERVVASGIPVRPEFSAPFDPAAVRARHGLRADVPVVLISAGAAGGPKALQVVRQCLDLPQEFQAVVVCGRNEDLRAQMESLVAGHPDVHVLGFTQEMPDLMRISSLFVGKPGGLSSSECMAAGLPMVLVDPIPGQEERNADFLLESGAAVRCNYATTIGYKIGTLLDDPARLAGMRDSARRIGRPDAARVVAGASSDSSLPPLWISRDAQRIMQRASTAADDVSVQAASEPLRTLTDPDTGSSLALVAESELATLGATPGMSLLELGRIRLRALRWQPEHFALAAAGTWLLGDAGSRTVGIR